MAEYNITLNTPSLNEDTIPKQSTDKPPARTRNKWTQWFVQMMTVQAKGCGLEIIYDYQLYKEPMRVDVVVVKKTVDVVIENTAVLKT